MKWTRTKFHSAVRQLKKDSNRLKSDALCEVAMVGNRAIFDEMRKLSNGVSNSQDIPDTLQGKVTFDDILNKFKECYESLYNSAPTKDVMIDLNHQVKSLIESDVLSSKFEVEKNSSAVVKDAIHAMKADKMDVCWLIY